MRFLIGFTLLCNFCSAKIYYVKVNGGTGAGTDTATAWSYANQFNRTQYPGDTVLFKRGEVFAGQFYAKSGSSAQPVVYGAWGTGSNPVISGFTTLKSWTLFSGRIYYANLAATAMVQGVVLNGVAKGMGRYPNTGYLTYTSHVTNTSITGAPVGAIPFDPTGAEVVIRKFRFILDRHYVTGRSGNTLTYDATNFYGSNSYYSPVDGNGFFIQNSLSTLDQDGEWYYDKSTQRLYMYLSTGSPAGQSVKVSTIDQLVPLNQASYITFMGLDFEGANTVYKITVQTILQSTIAIFVNRHPMQFTA